MKFHGVFLSLLILFTIHNLHARDVYIEGGLDQDGDGKQEFLIWSPMPGDSTLSYAEMGETSLETLWSWSYAPENSSRITDVKLSDINGDGFQDIVAVSRSIYGEKDKKEPWLFIFISDGNTFSLEPATVSESLNGTGRTRSTLLDLLSENGQTFAVMGEGTPDRQAVTFSVHTNGVEGAVDNVQHYRSGLISSGYGQVFAQGLQVEDQHFILLFSLESNLLKTAVFLLGNPEVIFEDVLVLSNAKQVIGPGVTHAVDEMGNESLLIPFKTGEVYSLSWDGNEFELRLNETFNPFHWPGSPSSLFSILSNYQRPQQDEEPEIEPEMTPPSFEIQYSDTVKIGSTFTTSIAPDSGKSFYSFTWLSTPPAGATLDLPAQTISWSPDRQDIGSHLFAYRQEFRLGETVTQFEDENGTRHQVVPELEEVETVFALLVEDTISVTMDYPDSAVFEMEPPRMFSLIVTVPSALESDRFRFEGISPFGIMVHESKEIPGTGMKLVGHDIIADLNRIETDTEVHFRYYASDTTQDSGSTLTIIHDLESNIMYMSAAPELDTVQQSFHPEAWDEALYNYPEYFFEGFPASMKMDSSRQSLVFSFEEDVQTNILNSSVMMMSPMDPTHWLSLYMDEGALAEIRGEVKVKENQSKKIIIHIDFSGDFFPQMLRTRMSHDSEEPPLYTAPVTPLPVRDMMEIETPDSTVVPTDSAVVESVAPVMLDSLKLDADTISVMMDTTVTTSDTLMPSLPADTTRTDSLDQ